MGACNKMWFSGIPSFLHLAVDKATKKVLFGWFEYEEITRRYFVVIIKLKQIIEVHSLQIMLKIKKKRDL